jgi:hypothetical protein
MVKGDYFTGLTPAGIIRCLEVHGPRLYAPDLDAIHGLAWAGFLSADQLRRHFYPQSSERTTTNRLAQLAREAFFSRTASFPHSTPQSIGRPISLGQKTHACLRKASMPVGILHG